MTQSSESRVSSSSETSSNQKVTVLLSFFMFSLGLGIGLIVSFAQFYQSTDRKNDLGYDRKIISEVRSIMDQNFIGETPDRDDLTNSVINGYLDGYDSKYTNYYSADDWKNLQQENSGQFQGVGIRLLRVDGNIIIETPISGSPAESEGVKALDLIVSVDDEPVSGQGLGEVAEKIRGEVGSIVKLGIFRPSIGEELSFEIERRGFDLDSIEYREVTEDTALIEISQFTESNISEFQQQWDQAVEFVDSNNYENLVLDLRNNTGGWVVAARFVLEEFLPVNTLILKEEDNEGNITETFTGKDARLEDVNLVVLVNAGSASASEIVAGALKDYDRATLVGTQTTGKGVEQTIENLSNGGKLFVVFKKWLTPTGKNLSADQALSPDIEIDRTDEEIQSGIDAQLDKALEVLK